MKLIYQWVPWAYSNITCLEASELIEWEITDIIWVDDFFSLWESINDKNIWVIPIENSYAGNIHENLYNFLRYDFKIIWEINLEVHHCLLSKESDISDIKEVYSHSQALSQCHNFLKKNNIKPIKFSDTAWAAEMIKKLDKSWIWAIASSLAWNIYWLNILEESIQDQKWNTTRFLIVAPNNSIITFKKDSKTIYKTSIIFELKNIPASLYKCLWAFATNNVNLTKIESLPSLKNPFTYLFWIDFEWSTKDIPVQKSLEELKFFTNYIKILWEY